MEGGGCHFGKDSAPGSYNCLNKIKCLFKYFISRAKNFGLLLARKGNLRDYQRQRDLVISTLRTRASQLFSGVLVFFLSVFLLGQSIQEETGSVDNKAVRQKQVRCRRASGHAASLAENTKKHPIDYSTNCVTGVA